MNINNKFIRNFFDVQVKQSDDIWCDKVIYAYDSMIYILKGSLQQLEVYIKLYTNNNVIIDFVVVKKYQDKDVLWGEKTFECKYTYDIDKNEITEYISSANEIDIVIHNQIIYYISNNKDFIRILMIMKAYVLDE